MTKANKSGCVGVYWIVRDSCWRASIKVNGDYIHLGNFSTFEEAKEKRKEAQIKFGFTERHGT